MLTQLEKFISRYNLNLVYVSAQKLAFYAEVDMEKYTETQFIDCVTNKKQFMDIIKGP